MKRFAVVSAVVVCVLCSQVVFAAEGSGPDDRLTVNPIPDKPVVAEEEIEPLEAIGGYLWARVRDFGDIFTFKFGWGTYRSIGVQARIIYPIQIGAGIFEGWVFAIDRGCVATMKEVEVEGGISIFYPSYIARKVIWQTDDAERRNVFFGDVGDKKELTLEDLKMYDDENQHALTSTAQVQLPCLPRIELSVHWGELFDFPLSFFQISGLRVPAPFHKQDGPDGENGERIPAPSIFWHGQEKYESYE